MIVDMNELEKQRAKEIKNSGHYLEFRVLMGVDEDDGISIPIITTELHDCTSTEISKLYIALKAEIDDLLVNYPKECAYALRSMSINHINTAECPLDLDDSQKEEKDENNPV